MALYRFRVTFEDNEDISRDIDIKGTNSFMDLHNALHASIGFDPGFNGCFFMSNDYWHKGEEINNTKRDGAKQMADVKIGQMIEDPHQRIYYTFTDSGRTWTFYIELLKILDEVAGKTYPLCSKTTGVAPKQFIKTPLISKEDASAFDEAGFEEVYDNEDYGLESEQGEDLFADNDEAEAESDNDADEDFGIEGGVANDDEY